MARKTAISNIMKRSVESSFDKIEKLEQRILRIEKWIIGGMAAILLAVLSNNF
jgi:hypothetical protein